MDWLTLFENWQDEWFNTWIAPWLYEWGLGNRLEMAYDAINWFWIGLVQVAVIALVLMPLERLRPVEPPQWSRAVRVDVLYTLIHRLGLFRLFFFFTLEPLVQLGINALRLAGLPTFSIDQLWPGVTDHAGVSFVIYLVVTHFYISLIVN